jgi:hypothetical protein
LNLKNNKITVGELWDYPAANTILRRRIPLVAKHAPTGAARTITLEQLLAFVGPYVPPKMVQDILRELQQA